MGIERHSELKDILEKKPQYRELLYAKSYLITTDKSLDLNSYPFFGKYKKYEYNGIVFLTDRRSRLFTHLSDGDLFFLIGDVCDPFEKLYKDMDVLEKLAGAYHKGEYFKKLNDLTGIFLTGVIDSDGKINFCSDACCIQTAYYGYVKENIYISSHAQLLGDICGLERDPYIKELISYRHYRKFGRMLPGDLSPYKEFIHTIPNNSVCFKNGKFSIKRFWPTVKITQKDGRDYDRVIRECAEILHSTLCLYSEKYGNAAISMTGGCDSKTTLSCANGLYDKFKYFSYISSETEAPDASAAKGIADQIGVAHETHRIPYNDDAFDDIEILRMIINCNCGYIGVNNENDVRKRAYYLKNKTFDTEIKSWVSEVARAYYHKRFAKKKFPEKVTPRYLTAMYKVFYTERSLVRKTDKKFKEYLEKYYAPDVFDKVPWTDLIFWEYRVSSWNALTISHEQRLSYDIAIPYNNRRLLELFLSTPLDYRIDDKPHKDIQKLMNKKIAETGINVVNVKHTDKRAKMERMYLAVQTKLPF